MGPLSLDLRKRVVTAIREEGISCRAAARQFKVSYASAIRWAQAMRERGSFAPLTMAATPARDAWRRMPIISCVCTGSNRT